MQRKFGDKSQEIRWKHTKKGAVIGLEIDENQQVLDRNFEPIPGLFATGNCSGRRFGVQYTTSLPGQSIGIAQTLGRELGLYLAQKQENEGR